MSLAMSCAVATNVVLHATNVGARTVGPICHKKPFQSAKDDTLVMDTKLNIIEILQVKYNSNIEVLGFILFKIVFYAFLCSTVYFECSVGL